MTSPPRASAPGIPFWAWASLPLLAGAWLRLRGLANLEPFVDEGANILTALNPGVRQAFEPLEQGRPWLTSLFAPAGWAPEQALVTARAMSALAGLATLGTLGWILHQLSGRTAALAGLWIWAVLPIAVWHERLALQDPFVTAALAGGLGLLLAGTRAEAGNAAAWLAGAGILFGTAFLLKISALFALPWLALVYVGVQRQRGRPWPDVRLGWVLAGAVALVLTLGTGLLRLGSKLGRYDALPHLGGSVITEAFNRFTVWLGWYAGYGGWPLLLVGAVATLAAARSRNRLAWWCGGAWMVSLFVGSFLFNNSYARYTLPDHLPLVLGLALAAGGVTAERGQRVVLGLGILALGGWGLASVQIGRDPAQAPVPRSEIVQYVTGPWSGHGTAEVRQFLTDYADRHHTRCLVLVHRYLRPGCYALLLAELGDPRLSIVPFVVYEPEELATALAGLRHATAVTGQGAAFFLLYEGSIYPAPGWLNRPESPARLVHAVDRGGGEVFALYQAGP
jgi:4-amino-4-deoxy-L-arabinose transferase-like glycosyltransferase